MQKKPKRFAHKLQIPRRDLKTSGQLLPLFAHTYIAADWGFFDSGKLPENDFNVFGS